MKKYSKYRHKEVMEMRPITIEDVNFFKLEGIIVEDGVAVNIVDKCRMNGSPKVGDMIVRDITSIDKKFWLMDKDWFNNNFAIDNREEVLNTIIAGTLKATLNEGLGKVGVGMCTEILNACLHDNLPIELNVDKNSYNDLKIEQMLLGFGCIIVSKKVWTTEDVLTVEVGISVEPKIREYNE